LAQARKSARFWMRLIFGFAMGRTASVTPTPLPQNVEVLGAEALAALCAATGQHLLSILRGHAQAKAVATGAD
jgi:hypothetical protein